jgi:hypothetical protein
VGERERRIGANEAIFREVNERIEQLNRTFATLTETMEIMCECGELSCAQMISLSIADYERVRADSALFAVVPGHELTDVEDVVQEQDGFNVVRKHPGEPAAVAKATDPRS